MQPVSRERGDLAGALERGQMSAVADWAEAGIRNAIGQFAGIGGQADAIMLADRDQRRDADGCDRGGDVRPGEQGALLAFEDGGADGGRQIKCIGW